MSKFSKGPRVYVGNYPDYFTEDDLYNIFQDYDGIEIQNFFKKDKKCYSFISCVNKDQVSEIVSTLNRIDVCGRNLIVRPLEDNSKGGKRNEREKPPIFSTSNNEQEESFHRENSPFKHLPKKSLSSDSDESSLNKFSTTKMRHSSNSSSSSCPIFYKSQPEQAPSTSIVENPGITDNTLLFDRANNDCGIKKWPYQANPNESQGELLSIDSVFEQLSINNDGSSSQISGAKCIDSFHFACVVNFPLETSKKDLYELFSDCNPLHVFMICNWARFDREPTQALIAFSNADDVTNAIMNLDNTSYRHRTIFVSDVADEDLGPELLNFCAS